MNLQAFTTLLTGLLDSIFFSDSLSLSLSVFLSPSLSLALSSSNLLYVRQNTTSPKYHGGFSCSFFDASTLFLRSLSRLLSLSSSILASRHSEKYGCHDAATAAL